MSGPESVEVRPPSAAKPAATEAKAKKPRNPVERLVVWGLIAVLLVVMGIEGAALFGYKRTLANVEAAVARSDGPEGETLMIKEVEGLISGFPSHSVDPGTYEDVANYRWRSLVKNYGLHVAYRPKSGIVRDVYTDDAPEEKVPARDPPTEEELAAMQATHGEGAPAGGPPAGMGGRPRFDPMQADADGDGRLSRDEAPERMRESFDESDANADGYLDAGELEARRTQRAARRALEGAGEGDRPQRPAAEEETAVP